MQQRHIEERRKHRAMLERLLKEVRACSWVYSCVFVCVCVCVLRLNMSIVADILFY